MHIIHKYIYKNNINNIDNNYHELLFTAFYNCTLKILCMASYFYGKFGA